MAILLYLFKYFCKINSDKSHVWYRESPTVDELFSSFSVKAAASCSHPEAHLEGHISNLQMCTWLGPCLK